MPFKTIDEARDYLPLSDIEVVIYHNPCNDGITSALAAFMVLRDKAVYIPASYDEPVPVEAIQGKNVLLVDFSYTEAKKRALLEKHAKKCLVLDHHEKAAQKLADSDYLYVDQSHSGAVIAWQFFHEDKPIPRFFKLVQDIDIWQHQVEGSEAFSHGYRSVLGRLGIHKGPINLSILLRYLDDRHVDKAVARGTRMLQEINKRVDECCSIADEATYTDEKGKVYQIAIIETQPGDDVSKIGNELCKRREIEFAAMFHKVEKHNEAGEVTETYFALSLRSVEGGANVNHIANRFQGGGHPRAAGCTLQMHPHLLFKPITSTAYLVCGQHASGTSATKRKAAGELLSKGAHARRSARTLKR